MVICLAIRVSYRRPDVSILVADVACYTIEHEALPIMPAPDA